MISSNIESRMQMWVGMGRGSSHEGHPEAFYSLEYAARLPSLLY